MRNNLTTALLGSILVCGVAEAQGLVDRTTDYNHPEGTVHRSGQIRGWANEAQRAQANAQREALGLPTSDSPMGGPALIRHRYSVGNSTQPLEVDGTRLTLDDGTQIDRYRFGSDQAAFDYALYGSELGSQDARVEARGTDVVVIRGTGLDNAQRASQLSEAAFAGEPTGLVSATGTTLQSGGFAISTRRPDPILDAQIGETMTALRDGARSNPMDYEVLGPDHIGQTMDNGVNYAIQQTNGLTSAVMAGSLDQRANLDQVMASDAEAAFAVRDRMAEAAEAVEVADGPRDATELTDEEILERFNKQLEARRAAAAAKKDPNAAFALDREHQVGTASETGGSIVAKGTKKADGSTEWEFYDRETGETYDPVVDGPLTNRPRGPRPQHPEAAAYERNNSGGSGRIGSIGDRIGGD